MIKSLFDYDDGEKPQQTEENKPETEESIRRQLAEINLAETPVAAGDDDTQTITQIRQTDPEESFAEAVSEVEDDEIETIILPRIEQVYENSSEPPPARFNNISPDNQPFDEEETVIRPTETAPFPSRTAIEQLLSENADEPQQPPLFSTPAKYRNVFRTRCRPRPAKTSLKRLKMLPYPTPDL